MGRALLLAAIAVAASQPVTAQLAEAQPATVVAAAPTSVPPVVPPTPHPLESPFTLAQLKYDRVLSARLESRFAIKRLFREKGIRYPAAEVFLRIFKRERALEVWVRSAGMEQFALLKSYDICALAGELGPKRRQGDLQVPEGFYYIDQFNPVSDYYLSLHLDYPNRADLILGDSVNPGGDIFIHGGCNSEGCIAVTNDGIKELYWLSVEARGAGQQRIPVHIFPARLTDRDLPLLTKAFAKKPALTRFWNGLKPGFDYFETKQRVPRMAVDASGSYRVAGEERTDLPAPLGTPVNGGRAPQTGPVPLGTPVGGAQPPAQPVPQVEAEKGSAPLGKPVEGGKAPAPRKPAEGGKGPVPLGKPVGGN